MLDAFEALGPHLHSVVVIGAHAIYIRQARSHVALAEFTKDSDLAIDPRKLADFPRIEDAMQQAGFALGEVSPQPGLWFRKDGSEVDLMVPEMFAGAPAKGRRGARIRPHGDRVARRAAGLEGVVVDNDLMAVGALAPGDRRAFEVRVAAPAALLVSKLFKLGERVEASPHRLNDKDAHDVFRILIGTNAEDLRQRYQDLLDDKISRDVAATALRFLNQLFASGPSAIGSMMAGRAEDGVGEPETVTQQVTILASQLLESLEMQSG